MPAGQATGMLNDANLLSEGTKCLLELRIINYVMSELPISLPGQLKLLVILVKKLRNPSVELRRLPKSLVSLKLTIEEGAMLC